MWLAWLVQAPIPHLRYLWPATACLWTGGILVLLDWFNSHQHRRTRAILHLLVLVAFVGSLASNVRALLVGDSVILAYQFTGMSPRYASSGQSVGFDAMLQKKQAQLVASLPATARIEALAPETAMPIVLLSGRSSVYALDHDPRSQGERFSSLRQRTIASGTRVHASVIGARATRVRFLPREAMRFCASILQFRRRLTIVDRWAVTLGDHPLDGLRGVRAVLEAAHGSGRPPFTIYSELPDQPTQIGRAPTLGVRRSTLYPIDQGTLSLGGLSVRCFQ